MEYRDYEAVLARLHEVEADHLPAFRARLRIIRDRASVPVPFRAGKGQRRQFTRVDLWESHLALRLAEAGIPPVRIGLLFSRWVRPKNVFAKVSEYAPAGFTPTDLHMVIFTHLDVGKEKEEIEHSAELIEASELARHFAFNRTSHVLFFINISYLTSEI